TPNVVPAGAMVFQPSDERRRSGSHYTPRSLTEPIVRTTLRPVLEQLGPQPTPQQILGLKVCDPAMGSGAFLVEVCRQLGDQLVQAWRVHRCLPALPPDEDELLHARRLVAQRCLYGVDKNPMAVDLSKLSLWLATLAKDHPFTFLDHSLRCGDSLVGLTRQQIAAFHWQPTEYTHVLEQELTRQIERATEARRKIIAAPEETPYTDQQQAMGVAEEALDRVRRIGDLAIAAFFAADKPKEREQRRKEFLELVVRVRGSQGRAEDLTTWMRHLDTLHTGPHPIQPFHWEVEFPEVFTVDAKGKPNGGFDAIVGNPPFSGKNTLINSNREGIIEWFKSIHEDSHGNADLVAHFFRRAFNLIRTKGCFGLIATNTIGQGDTRSTGLRWICTHNGKIYFALKRLKWPGQAAVVVSVVNVCRGETPGPSFLDGSAVPVITAFLFHTGKNDDSAKLMTNTGKSFQGCILLGMGFTFDNADRTGKANSLSLRDELITNNPQNADRIFAYMGGEELNESPTHTPSRYVINFADWPLCRGDLGESWAAADDDTRSRWLRSGVAPLDYPDPVASDFPDLLEIITRRVRLERQTQKDDYGRRRWWHFLRPRPDLYTAINGLKRVLVVAQTSKTRAFTFLPNGMVYDQKLIIFAFSGYLPFGLLQSRIHAEWSFFSGSTMKDDAVYTPTDCFETFPFP
ncbi:MAG: Eco57I restriction-modification methylase domain-containing protein, partial [Planctomycetaceae bacterium]